MRPTKRRRFKEPRPRGPPKNPKVRVIHGSDSPAIPGPVCADQDDHIAVAFNKQTANDDCKLQMACRPGYCEIDGGDAVDDDSAATVVTDDLISVIACGTVLSYSDIVLDRNTPGFYSGTTAINVRLDEEKSKNKNTRKLLVSWSSSGDEETSTPQQYKVKCGVSYKCPQVQITPEKWACQVRFMMPPAGMAQELSVAFYSSFDDEAVDMPKATKYVVDYFGPEFNWAGFEEMTNGLGMNGKNTDDDRDNDSKCEI